MGSCLKYAAGAVFGYETVMIFSNRKHTVSYLCGRKPVLIPVVMTALGVHLAHAYYLHRKVL